MKRLPAIQEESAQDSFLDVIANLVGVIIILVMLVGAKATRDVLKNTGRRAEAVPATRPELPAGDNSSLAQDVAAARVQALAARAELEKLATQLVRMRAETAEFDKDRVTLAMHRTVIEEDIARRRGQLDAEKQQEFDVQRKIAESQIKLDQLTKQQMGLLSGPETVEVLESFPTPLAREVNGDAIALRIKNGLVSVIPFRELMAEAAARGDDIRRRLHDYGKVSEVFGPLDGYRIRLVVIRQGDPLAVTGPRAGQVERASIVSYVDVLPAGDVVGQEVEAAFAPGGAVYKYLQANRHATAHVAVFLHTDSFQYSAAMKRALWDLGLAVTMFPIAPEDSLRIGLNNTHGVAMAAQ